MKKYLVLFLSTLSSISAINAGCGSFGLGFGLGTFSGFVTNEIVHHAHHHPRREVIVHQPVKYVEVQRPVHYMEVKTVKTEPVFEGFREENKTLTTENKHLKRKISLLQDDLDSACSENNKLTKRIETLTTKLDTLEDSIERVNRKLQKTSLQ